MKTKYQISLFIAMLLLVTACVPPTGTPTAHPPSVTPAPSQVVTVTPLPSPLNPHEEQVKTPTPIPTPEGGMILNPSMEEPYNCAPAFCVPHGWTGYYVNPPWCRPGKPGCDIPCPSTCRKDNGVCVYEPGCYWAQPEFGSIGLEFAYRVNSGEHALKIFSSGRMWDAGVYQQVYHVPLGSALTFSVYAQAWQCFNWDNCQWGRLSDEPAAMNIAVGIDPFGGTDPYSDTVIWSEAGESFDHYSQFSVSAIARNQVVTVFVHGAPRWEYPRGNGNDLYIDDARLDAFIASEKIYLPFIVR